MSAPAAAAASSASAVNSAAAAAAVSAGVQSAGGFISSGIAAKANREAQQRAMRFNREEAQVAREFQQSLFDQQTALANSAYQRQMDDLRKAGLNPMLAIGNAHGSPMPSAGGSPAASTGAEHVDMSGVTAGLTGASHSAVEIARLQKDAAQAEAAIRNVNADTRVKEEVATTEGAKRDLMSVEALLKAAEKGYVSQKKISERILGAKFSAETSHTAASTKLLQDSFESMQAMYEYQKKHFGAKYAWETWNSVMRTVQQGVDIWQTLRSQKGSNVWLRVQQ